MSFCRCVGSTTIFTLIGFNSLFPSVFIFLVHFMAEFFTMGYMRMQNAYIADRKRVTQAACPIGSSKGFRAKKIKTLNVEDS